MSDSRSLIWTQRRQRTTRDRGGRILVLGHGENSLWAAVEYQADSDQQYLGLVSLSVWTLSPRCREHQIPPKPIATLSQRQLNGLQVRVAVENNRIFVFWTHNLHRTPAFPHFFLRLTLDKSHGSHEVWAAVPPCQTVALWSLRNLRSTLFSSPKEHSLLCRHPSLPVAKHGGIFCF